MFKEKSQGLGWSRWLKVKQGVAEEKGRIKKRVELRSGLRGCFHVQFFPLRDVTRAATKLDTIPGVICSRHIDKVGPQARLEL